MLVKNKQVFTIIAVIINSLLTTSPQKCVTICNNNSFTVSDKFSKFLIYT